VLSQAEKQSVTKLPTSHQQEKLWLHTTVLEANLTGKVYFACKNYRLCRHIFKQTEIFQLTLVHQA